MLVETMVTIVRLKGNSNIKAFCHWVAQMNLESAGLNVFKLKGKLEQPRKNIRLNYQKRWKTNYFMTEFEMNRTTELD